MATTFEQSTGPVPVLDTPSFKVLNDIYKYLQIQSGDNGTISAVQDLSDQQQREFKTQLINNKRSENNNRAVQNALKSITKNQNTEIKGMNNERKDRAVQNALFGNISKGINNTNNSITKLGSSLTKALSGLQDFIGNQFKRSLQSMNELSKVMRKANLSAADKDKIQLMASDALGNVQKYFNGLVKVSGNEISDFMGDLIASGKDLTSIGESQMASYIALRKGGLESEKAYVAAMTTSIESLKGPISTMRNHPGVAQAMNESLKDVTAAQVAAMGGWGSALNVFSENSKKYIERVGMAGIAASDGAKFISGQAKLSSGIIDQLSDDEMKTIPLMSTNIDKSLDNMMAADTKFLARVGAIADSWANLGMAQDAKARISGKVYSESEVRGNSSRNVEGGMIPLVFDELSASLNKATGGLFGAMSNRINELFGDSADIGTLVSTGFKAVTFLLSKIAFNTSTAGKILGPALGVAAIGALIVNRDKLKPIFEVISSVLKEALPDFSKLFGGTTSSLGSIFNSGSGKGLASSASSAMGNLGSSVKGSVDVEGIKSIFPKIGSILQSVGNVLKSVFGVLGPILPQLVGVLDKLVDKGIPAIAKVLDSFVPLIPSIIDSIANVVNKAVPAIEAISRDVSNIINNVLTSIREISLSLVTSVTKIVTNVIDSIREITIQALPIIREITPIIADVIKNVAPIIKDTIDILAPVFTELIKTGLPIIRDIVDIVAPIIGDIIKVAIPEVRGIVDNLVTNVFSVISQSINSLTEVLNKALDIIDHAVSIIEEAVRSVCNVIEGIQRTIETAVTDITGTVRNIGDTLCDTLTKLTDTILPPIKKFLEDIEPSAAKLANVLADVLADVFKAMKDPMIKIADVLDVALTPISFIANQIKGLDVIGGIGDVVSSAGGFLSGLLPFANGGVVNKPTRALVGEAGKEAIFPLTNFNALKNVLIKLTGAEKSLILSALLGNKSSNYTSDGSIAGNAIAFAKDQLGKPYSIYSDGYVCNTLVQSAYRSAGMKNFPSGTVSSHWKNPKLHIVPIDQAVAGMIGFSNKSDKTGYPQHMGIITENGNWINASGSAVNGNYSKGSFQATPTSKGVVEAKMNRTAKWGMVAAGYYDGMFDPSTMNYISRKSFDNPSGPDDSVLANNATNPAAVMTIPKEALDSAEATIADLEQLPSNTPLETLRNLSRRAMDSVMKYASGEDFYVTDKIADRASKSSSSREIIMALTEIVRYLRSIAGNSKQIPAAARPMPNRVA
jgi:phage-related protein/cell wall-associated NlpC family hydrolase